MTLFFFIIKEFQCHLSFVICDIPFISQHIKTIQHIRSAKNKTTMPETRNHH